MIDIPDRAIAVIQPWAYFIVHGLKDIENRDWRTHYRGPVAIHASKHMSEDQWIGATDMLFETRYDAMVITPGLRDRLQFGGIVGVVDVVDCVEQSDSPWFVGRYGFKLENARAVPFIPVIGKQGFFNWRERIAA